MVQYNCGLLPDIILLLTKCYYHRGTRLNAMNEEVSYLQPMIPPKSFDIFIFPPDWGMLRRYRRVLIFLNFFFTKGTISLDTAQFVILGLGSDGCRWRKSTSYRLM